jgi:hypothetical protein
VIVAPGVLLDVAVKDGVNSLEPNRVVTAANLACCERQGLVVEPGSVALVRLCNARFWDDEECYLTGPGMDGGAAR